MIPIRLKDDSINPVGIRPELLLAIMTAQAVYERAGAAELVITSLVDAHHSATSLHYSGCAVDIRTRNLPDGTDYRNVAEAIKKHLNVHYDVVTEAHTVGGQTVRHIHIEFQPRHPQ